MANPKVRPHLSFYPEDSGPKLSEARQGQRWLKELPDTQTTPMLRIGKQDYFIHEPAMLSDGTCCIPTRWFLKNGEYFANCWQLDPVVSDEHSGWRVIIRTEAYVVPAADFLKNLPEFERDADHHGVPNPTSIIGQVFFSSVQQHSLIYIPQTSLIAPQAQVLHGHTQIRRRVTNGGLEQEEPVLLSFLCGCTVTIHLGMCPRSGTSTTAFW